MKADVFISIHANSSKRRGQAGDRVFFLSLRGASDQADADLADVENAADLRGRGAATSESDLRQHSHDVKRSSRCSRASCSPESLLDRLASRPRLESRGVKRPVSWC